MIYYTYSFRKSNVAIFLHQQNLVDGIIISRQNSKEDEAKVIKKFNNHNIPVIYDNPIYVSSMLDYDAEEVIERNMQEFIFNRKDFFENIEDKIIEKLNRYNEVAINLDAEYVLGLPLDNLLIKNDLHYRIIDRIEPFNYKYISTMINSNDSEEMLNKKLKILLKYSEHFKIKKILITIKTIVHDENIDSHKDIQFFINQLKNEGIEIIVHHGLNYFHLFSGFNSIAACGYKQGNSISNDVAPFFHYGSQARSSQWFYSDISYCQVSSDALLNEIEPLYDIESKEEGLKFLKKIYRARKNVESQFNDKIVKTNKNEYVTFQSIKNILNKSIETIRSETIEAETKRIMVPKTNWKIFKSKIKTFL